MSGRRQLSASTVVLVVGNVFPPAATFAMAPFLAHALGVDARGELAAVTAPYLLAISMATLGIPDAVTQATASGRPLRRASWLSAWALLGVAGTRAALVAAVVAPLIVGNGRSDLTSLIALATTATVPALLVALLRGRAAGRHDWKAVSAERIVGACVKVLGTVVLWATDRLDLASATALIAVAPVVGGVVYLVARPDRGTCAGTDTGPRALLGFSMRSWLGSVAGVLLVRVDQLLVLPLSDAAQLGLYVVAVNVSEVPLIVTNAVREVMLSHDAAARDDVRVPRAARAATVVAIAVALPVALTAAFWVPVVFGADFAPAVPALVIAVVAVLVGVPGSIAGSTLTARGRPELRSTSILVGCIANVAALVLLVPVLGAVGAAGATLVGNLLSGNGSVLGAARLTGIPMREFYALRPSDVGRVSTLLSALVRRPSSGV